MPREPIQRPAAGGADTEDSLSRRTRRGQPTSPRLPPKSALRRRTRRPPPCLGSSPFRTPPSRPPSPCDRPLLRSCPRSSLRHVSPGPRIAGSRVRPRQYRGGMVTFGAVLASTGCAGIALVLTGWKFFAVHAHVRAPPAPYWVRAPRPRTRPRPWAGARSESRPTAALCSGRNPKTASPAFV